MGASTTPSAQPPDPRTQPVTSPAAIAPAATPLPARDTAETAQLTVPYTVVPGDHFWGISEQVLRMRLGSQPTASEIAQYSAQLIANNQEALTDPENPGLILVGQVFQLP
jgi:nucleoid-associated protein YgaU